MNPYEQHGPGSRAAEFQYADSGFEFRCIPLNTDCISCWISCSCMSCNLYNTNAVNKTTLLRGQGGLHQDFLTIEFLVVSDRGE